jgi:hypothetical protein
MGSNAALDGSTRISVDIDDLVVASSRRNFRSPRLRYKYTIPQLRASNTIRRLIA